MNYILFKKHAHAVVDLIVNVISNSHLMLFEETVGYNRINHEVVAMLLILSSIDKILKHSIITTVISMFLGQY